MTEDMARWVRAAKSLIAFVHANVDSPDSEINQQLAVLQNAEEDARRTANENILRTGWTMAPQREHALSSAVLGAIVLEHMVPWQRAVVATLAVDGNRVGAVRMARHWVEGLSLYAAVKAVDLLRDRALLGHDDTHGLPPRVAVDFLDRYDALNREERHIRALLNLPPDDLSPVGTSPSPVRRIPPGMPDLDD
jgi:hypothetical protein